MRICWLVIALLCLARSSAAQERQLFKFSLASAVVAHSMDLAETEHCLGAGKCRELNPWLLRFQSPSGFALAKMSLATGTLWITAEVFDRCESRSCKWLAIGSNLGQALAFAAIAVHNRRVSR